MNNVARVSKLTKLALLSCLAMPAYAVETETVVGGVVGAGAGTGVAAITSGHLAVGAGIGAVLGALIGNEIAKNEKDPNLALDGSGMRIIDDRFGTSLVLSTDMAFKRGSTQVIEPRYFPVLNQVVKVLKQYPDAKISISGHTDTIYNRAMAMEKSHEYAKSISDYFLSKGIDGQRMIAVMANGAKKPNYSNDTPMGRKMNRRVEITVHTQLP